jgi:predicted O-methyltransferase YrrM
MNCDERGLFSSLRGRKRVVTSKMPDQSSLRTTNERNQSVDLQKHREAWLSQTRREWYRVMRPLGSWVPWDLADQLELDDIEVEDYFRPALRLDERHVRNCRVVPDRIDLLKTCLPKHGIVAELGTDHGDFAAMILQFAAPKELHIIDITLAQFRREVFASAIDQGTVRLHESDSVEALRRFSDGYFDWIYIDANHSYAGVKRDIDEAKKKVKGDGLLVFNDYIFWSHREFMAYGVVQAVNEFCLAEDWELLYLVLHPEMYGDVVLRKI